MRTFLRRTSKRSGFTLLEVIVTASVLLVGLLAMTSTSVVVNSLRRSASDLQRAQQAMQVLVEDLHAAAREADDDASAWAADVLSLYGPGGTPGDSFTIDGLDPWEGETDVAFINLVTDETTTDAALGVALGMPRDLDGNGSATNTDVSGSASILPAVIRLQWSGSAGPQQLTQVIYLLRF